MLSPSDNRFPVSAAAAALLRLVSDYAFLLRVEPDGRLVEEWSNQGLE